jgi:hypothetical protein
VTTGVGSCAAGLRDSMTSYQAVLGGEVAELGTAKSIVAYGASNCQVATNESLSDFDNYQVSESLDSLNLDTADNDVITWAFDATAYQQDLLAVLAASNGPARARAEALVKPALATLNAERATIDATWNAAKKSTGDASPLPDLTALPQADQNASGAG